MSACAEAEQVVESVVRHVTVWHYCTLAYISCLGVTINLPELMLHAINDFVVCCQAYCIVAMVFTARIDRCFRQQVNSGSNTLLLLLQNDPTTRLYYYSCTVIYLQSLPY